VNAARSLYENPEKFNDDVLNILAEIFCLTGSAKESLHNRWLAVKTERCSALASSPAELFELLGVSGGGHEWSASTHWKAPGQMEVEETERRSSAKVSHKECSSSTVATQESSESAPAPLPVAQTFMRREVSPPKGGPPNHLYLVRDKRTWTSTMPEYDSFKPVEHVSNDYEVPTGFQVYKELFEQTGSLYLGTIIETGNGKEASLIEWLPHIIDDTRAPVSLYLLLVDFLT
jgi:hypothetical protein